MMERESLFMERVRRVALQLCAGLLVLVGLLAVLAPVLLPDPWGIGYAVTMLVLLLAYLIGKDIVRV